MREDRRRRPPSPGAAARARESSARAFAASVQSQCLSSVSSARTDDAGGGVVDDDAYGPRGRELVDHPLRRDVAAHEHRLGAGCAQLRGGLLGRACRCAGSRARRVLRRRPRAGARSPVPIPRVPPVTRTDAPSRAHAAGAARRPAPSSGSSLQPGRVCGSRRLSAAFEDACPSRSSNSIFSSRVLPHRVLLGQVERRAPHARAELVGEVRGRGPDERVDVV